ncbi:Gypsy retrotransposon integrase-like protein 1 [Entomophthora muscae]|uniref:Gypsy retrotransposon integrase-like protein 1 n=1 Tax=Entomophthora muscae TaxID=34485 RepID=A0ACC2USJ2_9FUNG|nr:Gypsy retrotransposon integrase-like protein 1 [Entomophthora muscae]
MEEPNPSLPKQALIAVVCLSGAWCYSDKSYIKDITTFLAERLWGLFSKIYSKPCVQTVQAFLIACLEQNPEQSCTILKHSWYYYALACDMARMLGFHRKNPRLDPFIQEERTRIWMGIYTASIAYHISTGKHYSISYAHTDIPLWQLKDKKKTNAEPLYGEDKYIVNHFRNIITSSAIVEMLHRAKHQFQHSTRNKDATKAKKVFRLKLEEIEKYYIS